MTEILHGLVSGLSWSATLAICLIAIAFVVTVTVSASAGCPTCPRERLAPATDRRSRTAARPGRTAMLLEPRCGPRPDRIAPAAGSSSTWPASRG